MGKAIPVTNKEWKGLNSADDRATFESGYLYNAQNVDFPDSKTIRKRPGFEKFNASAPVGASDRIYILGRHKTSNGDKIYFQITDSNGVGTKLYRCNLDQTSVEEVTLAAASITGKLYGYQYNDLFYVLRSASTLLSVTMASAAATSIGSSPSGSQMIAHKGRLWILDGYGTFGTSVTRLYFSTTALTWGTGDAGNIDINFGDGKPLIAAVVLSDFLIIFKQDSTWTINADAADTGDWVVRNISSSIGCIGRDSIQVIDGQVFFLSQRGVYTTDGITYTEISNNIKPNVQANYTPAGFSIMLTYSSAFFNDRYILATPWVFGSQSAIVYNTRTGAWSQWVFANISLAGLLVCEDAVIGSLPGIISGNFGATGRLYRFRETAVYQDDGNNFSVIIETGELTYDSPSQFKRSLGIDLDVSASSSTSFTYSFQNVYDNESVEAAQTVSTVLPRSIQRVKGPGYFRYCRQKITVAANFPFELFSITNWLIVKDRVSYAH